MRIIFDTILAGLKWLGLMIGKINTELILFLFFFVIFTPYGFILRIFGRNQLSKMISQNSNWQDSEIGKFDESKSIRQS